MQRIFFCAKDLFVFHLLICIDIGPLGRVSVTFHSVKTKENKTRMHLHLGGFDSAGPQKTSAKVLSVLRRNLGRQRPEMLRPTVTQTKRFTSIYSSDNTCIGVNVAFCGQPWREKKRLIIYINNYFIERIHTVKLQLLNHS